MHKSIDRFWAEYLVIVQLTKHLIVELSVQLYERFHPAHFIKHLHRTVTFSEEASYHERRRKTHNCFAMSLHLVFIFSGEQKHNVDKSKLKCVCRKGSGQEYLISHACATLLYFKPEIEMNVYDHAQAYFSTSVYK